MKKLTRKSLENLAKSMKIIDEVGQGKFVGGGNGTYDDPFTESEFNSMCNTGTWNGGYVNGYGYVGNDAYVYGSSTYPTSTSQDYYTFPEYVTSLSSSGFDQFAQFLIDKIPGIGTYVGYLSDQYGNMTRDIQNELLKRGYDGSSSFNIISTSEGNSVKFSVYDANTGNYICDRTINIAGQWH